LYLLDFDKYKTFNLSSESALPDAFLLVEWLYTDTSRHICHVSATRLKLQSKRILVELILKVNHLSVLF